MEPFCVVMSNRLLLRKGRLFLMSITRSRIAEILKLLRPVHFLAFSLLMVARTDPAFAQAGTTTNNATVADNPNVETDFLQEGTDKAAPFPDPALSFINQQDGTISNAGVLQLLTLLFSSTGTPAEAYAKKNFASLFHGTATAPTAQQLDTGALTKVSFIINVVVWAPDKSKGQTANNILVPTQRWYVYRDGKLTPQKRLLGVRRFYFLYVHINRGGAEYVTNYSFTSTQATPVFLQHVYTLASVLTQAQSQEGTLGTNIWGGREFDFSYKTSDIAVTSNITNTGPASTPAPKDGAIDAAQTFHNEAGPWVDLTIGYPATNVNTLSFDSTTNGLTPKTIDQRRLFGLLNFYPLKQQRKQLAENNFTWYPALITGLPLASQPLHKPVVAVGWGLPLLQFYIGSIIAKQPYPTAGSALTKSACSGWCPQFTFGVNFSVTALKKQVTKK
jgi:hypothetical protein